MSAVDVVQRQLEAYNDRALDRFLATYSETVTAYRMPSAEPILQGKAALAEFYATQRFNRTELRADLLSRIVLGNKVMDHERVFGVRDGPFEVVVVYQVIGDLIEHVWTFAPD